MGLLSASLLACSLDNPGVSPPKGALAYPIAVALSVETEGAGESAAPKYLYVANSNFDVRYNAGSVHSYNLVKLAEAIESKGCRDYDVPTVASSDGGTQTIPFPMPGVDDTDAGPGEAGVPDGGAGDGGLPDGGPADGGPADGGVDAGELDAGGLDAGGLDAGEGVTLPVDYGAATEYGTLRGLLCDGRDPQDHEDPTRDPTVCCFSNNVDYLHSEVLTDSFATGLARRSKGAGAGERLYVPVRSKGDLLYIDVENDGELSCAKDDDRCKDKADGSNPDAPSDSFAADPTALTVGTLADLGVSAGARADRVFIATAHDGAELNLFVEPSKDAAPLLQDAIETTLLRATSVSLNPAEHLLYATAASRGFIERYGVRKQVEGEREVLVAASRVGLSGLSSADASTDIRDVLVDSEDPTMIYGLVRGLLQSVVFLHRDDTLGPHAKLLDAVRVGAGPSKLVQATFGGQRVLLVSCYDARSIFIIDVKTRKLIEVVRGLSGPFSMAIDEARQLMFVADFGASVLRVVDMEGVSDRSRPPPRIIATLGEPTFAGGI